MTRSIPRRSPSGRASALALGLVALIGPAACGSDRGGGQGASTAAATTSGGPSGGSAPASGAAEQYCTDQGGQLVPRTAIWNTNADQSVWLPMAGQMTLCEFETGSGDTTTRIAVDLTTLNSEQPTIASVAYLSKVRTTSPPESSTNPAEYSCANDYAGASTFGTSLAGGGWVNDDQPVFKVMIMCVFADESAIDAFGLWYHANGVVRGADLTDKFRYEPGDKLPAMFARHR
jgi:hypothetical protein